jgi:hypothetical protein
MISSPQDTSPMPYSNPANIPLDDTLQSSIQETAQEILENGTWQHLKQAISETSGFKRWQRSLHLSVGANGSDQNSELITDHEVSAEAISRYLRETLETLAY